MQRDLKQIKKADENRKIKQRLENLKIKRKINLDSKIIWPLLVSNLCYIILLTINFLLISVGHHSSSKSGTTDNNLQYHLLFYLMPTLLNILFSVLIYFSRLKISLGNFFVIFWAAIWILGLVLPFVFNDSTFTVITILAAFPLAINVIFLFFIYYKVYKHRELLKIKYYNKKLANL